MSCTGGELFAKFLTDRTQYIDDEILQDWFPTEDAWVGQVSVGQWPAEMGNTHSFDRIHIAYPNLFGGREAVDNTSCVGTPCSPTEKKIGWGMTRNDYSKYNESFTTDLICWDSNITIWKAQEKWALLVSKLKDTSKIINSNRFKVEALKGAGTLYLAGNAAATTPVSLDSTEQVLDTAGLYPTSKLTMPYLMRFVEPLRLTGYFHEKNMPNGKQMPKYKLITDDISSYDLQQGNASLAALFRFDDFQRGGQLYEYGASSGVGNFMISVDSTPPRFNKRASDGKLVRVLPYENSAATVGIKQTLSSQYQNAEYQLSTIWHPNAMRILVAQGEVLNPEMPYLVRDFAGTWRFAMDNLVVDGAPVDNKRRNQGLFYADFESGTKYERPELVRQILHLHEPSCVANAALCSTPSAYSTQNTSSANTPCTSLFTFTVTDDLPWEVNEITCNGVALDLGSGSGSLANAAALETYLTSNFEQLGTWDVTGTTITLTGSSCTCVTITVATYTA